MPLGLALLLSRRRWWDAPIMAATALLTVALVLLAYYQFSVQAAIDHLTLTRAFMVTHAASTDRLAWWWQTLSAWPLSRAHLTLLLPLAMLASLLIRCHWRTTVPLLVGYLMALLVLAGRPELNTWTETEMFALAAGVVWARGMIGARRATWLVGKRGVRPTTTGAALLLALSLLYFETIPNALALADSVRPILAATERTEPMIDSFLREGRTAWLMADGQPYLATSHAARAKGGTDIGSTNYSPWMREAWPHDPDLYWGSFQPLDLSQYDRLILTSDRFRIRLDSEAPLPFSTIIGEVWRVWRVNVADWTCVTFPPSQTRWPVVLCRR